ncbi:MAG: type II toxin-antitoxin system RelE/ParE family toxin [Paludibacter sp.]
MIRQIIAYKRYFADFLDTLSEQEKRKIFYILDMLKTQDRLSTKFVKHIQDGIYEIRTEYNGNIYRLFFIFDDRKIVVLFNGFQKKTQKTPQNEIDKALKIKEDYYENK